jgi:hypothetical protein
MTNGALSRSTMHVDREGKKIDVIDRKFAAFWACEQKENMRYVGMSIIESNKVPVDRWTLRIVVERGSLAFECRNCRRLSQVDVLALIEQHGADGLVAAVRRRLVCRQCGARSPRALVRLHGVRGDRAWLPVPPRAGR